MAIKFQTRRGTASNWSSTNPILAAGEIGFETDTNKLKIGNGSNTWNQLSYIEGTTSNASLLTSGTLSNDRLDSNLYAPSITSEGFKIGSEYEHLLYGPSANAIGFRVGNNGPYYVISAGAVGSGLDEMKIGPSNPTADLVLQTGYLSNATEWLRIDSSLNQMNITGNLVASNLLFTQSRANTVSRSMISKLNDFISVKDFGAVGDGSTDDTLFIKNALDYISQSNTGCLYFPAGTYMISSGIIIPKNCELRGEGVSTIIKLSSSYNQNTFPEVFSATSTVGIGKGNRDSTVVIKSIVFDGNRESVPFPQAGWPAGYRPRILSLEKLKSPIISDCVFKNFAGYAIEEYGCESLLFCNNLITNCGRTDALQTTFYSAQSREDGTRSVGLKIHDNSFISNLQGACDVYGTSVSVCDNYFYDHNDTVLFVAYVDQGATINNNYFDKTTISYAAGNHIEVEFSRNVIINGNILRNSVHAGISVAASHNITIVGNEIYNCAWGKSKILDAEWLNCGIILTSLNRQPNENVNIIGNKFISTVNYALHSQNFVNSYWEKYQCTITSNNNIAPDGTNTASLITATGSDPIIQRYPFSNLALNNILTGSIWIKGINSSIGKTCTISIGNNSSLVAVQNYTLTNNWQRISCTAGELITMGYTDPDASLRIDMVESANVGEQVYLWGAQLEEGSDASNYSATTDSISGIGQKYCISGNQGGANSDISPPIENLTITGNSFKGGYAPNGYPVRFFDRAIPGEPINYSDNTDGILGIPKRGYWAKGSLILNDVTSEENPYYVCTKSGWAASNTWTSGAIYAAEDYIEVVGANTTTPGVMRVAQSSGLPTNTKPSNVLGITYVTTPDGYTWLYCGNTRATFTANTVSSSVKFTQNGSNAIARTAQSKLREFVSVEDFGAVGDGVANDYSAIMNAYDSLPPTGGTIYMPNRYAIGAQLTFSTVGKPVRLVGEHQGRKFLPVQNSRSEIIWIGGVTSNAMIRMGNYDGLDGTTGILIGGGIENIYINGNALAGIGLELSDMQRGVFKDIVVNNVTVAGMKLSASGKKDNQPSGFHRFYGCSFDLRSSLEVSANAHGILIDSPTIPGPNVAQNAGHTLNYFEDLSITHSGGDGIHWKEGGDGFIFMKPQIFRADAETGWGCNFSSTNAADICNHTIFFYPIISAGIYFAKAGIHHGTAIHDYDGQNIRGHTNVATGQIYLSELLNGPGASDVMGHSSFGQKFGVSRLGSTWDTLIDDSMSLVHYASGASPPYFLTSQGAWSLAVDHASAVSALGTPGGGIKLSTAASLNSNCMLTHTSTVNGPSTLNWPSAQFGINIPNNGANTTARWGFFSNNADTPTDGIWIECDSRLSSGQYRIVTSRGGNRTYDVVKNLNGDPMTPTGNPTLRWRIDVQPGNATFYVAGVDVPNPQLWTYANTISTNVPANTTAMGCGVQVLSRNTSPTASSVNVGHIKLAQRTSYIKTKEILANT